MGKNRRQKRREDGRGDGDRSEEDCKGRRGKDWEEKRREEKRGRKIGEERKREEEQKRII